MEDNIYFVKKINGVTGSCWLGDERINFAHLSSRAVKMNIIYPNFMSIFSLMDVYVNHSPSVSKLNIPNPEAAASKRQLINLLSIIQTPSHPGPNICEREKNKIE